MSQSADGMGVVKTDPLVQQILERLPSSVIFSRDQIEALKEAIAALNWRRHVVDVRLSKLSFYLILLGGTERRSQKRLAVERAEQQIITPANFIVFLLVSILFSFAGIGVVCQLKKLLSMS